MVLSLFAVVFLAGYYVLPEARWHKTLFYVGLLPLLWHGWQCRAVWREWLGACCVLLGLVALYLGYQALSLSWSPIASPQEAGELVRKSALTLAYVAMVAVSVRYLSPAWGVRAAVILALSAGFALGLFWQEVPIHGRLEGFGRAENPNQAGALYGLGLLGCSAVFLNKELSGRARYGVLLAWVLVLLALILSQSRGAWMAALAGHSLLLALRGRRLRKPVVMGGGLALIAAVTVASLQIDWMTIIARLDGYRLLIWQTALHDLSWLSGHGFRMPFALTLPYGETVYQPHSIYVTALYYGGLPGLLALLALYAAVGWRLWQNRQAFGLALWGNALVFGAVDFNLLLVNSGIEWLVFWTPVALALAGTPEKCVKGKHENSA